jgi:hypothetical protein
MRRATILTLPWYATRPLDTQGWCLLHRQHICCGVLEAVRHRVINPLLARRPEPVVAADGALEGSGVAAL